MREKVGASISSILKTYSLLNESETRALVISLLAVKVKLNGSYFIYITVEQDSIFTSTPSI